MAICKRIEAAEDEILSALASSRFAVGQLTKLVPGLRDGRTDLSAVVRDGEASRNDQVPRTLDRLCKLNRDAEARGPAAGRAEIGAGAQAADA